ncbi:hypothetical protein [Thermophilibacter sp.]|uniref:hypothetical protein n=1 Tax=Thermophilibacter sp. TaxID=2847309 RepID=UPI003A91298B
MTNKWWKATFAALLVVLAALACPIAAHAEDPAPASLSTVYLAPSTGDDAASGSSPDAAVKSFERAKELLATDGTIELIGALRPTGIVTYSLEGKGDARIVRHNPDWADAYMLYVEDGASVTLDNIVFDGQGQKAADGLVRAENGSSLTLAEGAVLENSLTNSGNFGSAIAAYDNAHVVMEDGSAVRNNSTTSAGYGAVLLVNGSLFEMKGGEISGNRSSRGGGVALLASEMKMSGGTISNNTAYGSSSGDGYGGGVYVSNYEAYSGTPGSDVVKGADARFTMTGGTIENNHANVYGGGILTWAESRAPAGQTYVDLQGGTITNNSADDSGGGVVAFLWGGNDCHLSISGNTEISNNEATRFGGGVFLYGVGTSGLVEMSGGTIKGNDAGWSGGGIALYQISTMSVTGGSITGDNTAGSAGGGVFIQAQSTLTMTGGTIEGNNGTKDQSATKGDGVYVGGTFEVADGKNGGPVVDQNNDVYLPSGHVIDVIGSFSGATADNPINITSEDCKIEPEDAATPGTKLVNYQEAAGGETAAQAADEDGIYVPSAKMLAQNPTLGIGKSEYTGQTNYMTYVTEDPTLTLEVLDMTAYTGGDSHDSDPFPAPRYRARMNAQLEALLGSQDITDLQLTNADGEQVALFEVADGVYVAPALDEQYVYTGLNPEGRGARSGAPDDADAGTYTVSLAADEKLEVGAVSSQPVEVSVVPGTLTVRYVNDAEDVASGRAEVTTPVISADQLAGSDASTFRAVLDGSAVLTTNNRPELGLVGTGNTAATAAPALLADDLLLADDGSSREPVMRERAESYLEGQGISAARRSWDFQYLDLVNANDGNAWIASSIGADVYWPYPEGTDENTKFTLVHYSGLYREYGINGVDEIDDALAATELSTVSVENTPYGIKFHVDTNGYGPFALSWVSGTDGPKEPSTGTPSEGSLPTTGDASLSAAPVLLAGCAVAGLAALALRRR